MSRIGAATVGLGVALGAAGCGKTQQASRSFVPAAQPDASAPSTVVDTDAARAPRRDSGAPRDSATAPNGCPPPYSSCGGLCIDIATDGHNCGACGNACAAGELCSAGQCGITCLGGSSLCGPRCVDLAFDPSNCGACGNGCSVGEVCYNGRCGATCLGGTTTCNQACADLKIDPANCGACGHSCSGGAVCSNGTCGQSCPQGQAICGVDCVYLATDLGNCGACGHACSSGEVCSLGHCGTVCNDSIRCGTVCVDSLTDPKNCGGCGTACSGQQICVNGSCGLHCEVSGGSPCGGGCVDLSSNSANCGTCGSVCGAGYHCSTGQCACNQGTTLCQGACIDTNADAANCGTCGAACGNNEACSAAHCTCQSGTTRCDSACVDTAVNSANCGACGAPCPAGSVCTDGNCSAPTSDWPTFQYDVRHSGENTAELGKPPLTFAWSRTFGSSLQPPALAQGRLFVTASSYFSATSEVHALNVSDGSDLWSYNFGSVSSVGHPSCFGGSVYVANGPATVSTAYLWSFQSDTGDTQWAAAMSAQWEHYWAPIRVGDVVYTNAGTYGGLYGIGAADGAQKFFTSLDQYDSWSAAYSAGSLFTFIAGHFRKHDPVTGAVLSTLEIPWNWSGYSMGTAPVFGTSFAYVVAPPNLVAVSPSTNAVAWTANGTYAGTPAVAAGAVYGISAGNLVVRDASTGSLLWTFVGDTSLLYPPVLANGFVYVASNSNLFAVSVATHKQVATEAVGGWLILGSRRLVVAGSDGSLTAYTLSL